MSCAKKQKTKTDLFAQLHASKSPELHWGMGAWGGV